MSYRLRYTETALKQLETLPGKVQRQILRKADSLTGNPRPRNSQKLHGGDGLYRIRSGDYRIIYRVKDDELLVLVVRVGDRKEVYRSMAGL